MRTISVVFALFVSALIAAAPLSEKFSKRVVSIEETYAAAVTKADNARFFSVQKANADRVKGFKAILAEATKAGEFDTLADLRAKLSAAEKESTGRPKPKNTIKFGGHEYALVENKVSWHTAKRQCEEMGGHLVVFDSPDEQAFCLAACQSAKIAAWFGVSNEGDLDRFVWATGRPAVVDPSWTFDNGSEKDFAVALAYWPPSGVFNDHNMGGHLGYVCEWEK